MSASELPHTRGCLVCGRENPHGLHLSLFVEERTGVVTTTILTLPEHIGFEGVVHGGLLATVLDEAMVWAATWAGRRFCVCGELNVRFRQSVPVGADLHVEAKVAAQRSRLIETTGSIVGDEGLVYATSTGKYVPVSEQRNIQFVKTLVLSPTVATTMAALQSAVHPAP